MSSIQWLLLILVVAAVAGIYWYMRRQAAEDPWRGMEETDEGSQYDRGESLGGDSYIVGVRTIGQPSEPEEADRSAQEPAGQGDDDEPSWKAFTTGTDSKTLKDEKTRAVGEVRPQRPPAGEESLFILHVASRDSGFFDGPDIHAALQRQKLKFGLNDIYHRITEANGVPESVYSVANMLKPGYLDPVEEDHLSTPGLTLFLVLPGPIDGGRAMRDMLETAGALAEELGGEVLDDKRSLLKPQTAQYMLDQAAEMDRKQRLQASR